MMPLSFAPQRLPSPVGPPRPGETAYVLSQKPGPAPLRYLGLARWSRDKARWILPVPDEESAAP
jgi:hypothetical protein